MGEKNKMRRKVLIIIAFILPCLASSAQGIRYWSEGPLTWKDFRMADSADIEPSLSVSWIHELSKVKIGKTVYKYIDIQTISSPQNSWVGQSMLSGSALVKQQEYFDKAESIGRMMRDTLLYSSMQMKKLNRWASAKLREEFTANPPGKDSFDITKVPLDISRSGIGASLKFVRTLPLGDMSRLCGYFQTVAAEIEYNTGRLYFDAGCSFGYGKYKGDVIGVSGAGKEKKDLFIFGWNAGPGYVLSDGKFNRLSVFAQAGSKSYYFKPGPVRGLSIIEGIRLDHLIREKYLFLSSDKARNRQHLQISVFADQVWNSSKGVFIPSVNASIGLSFTRNGVKVK